MFADKKLVHPSLLFRAVADAIIIAGIATVASPAVGASNDVTISNGGLSVTFNLSWGAVVTSIANVNVANGLNLVDTVGVGREFQMDQFLMQDIGGSQQLMMNPTQAGAAGNQAYYQHPNGSQFPQVGSPVVNWSASGNQFQAVITPLDYDTGNPTDWIYVENVSINSQGIANFHFNCYDYQPQTYSMSTEMPTLYSDSTDAFMYPASNGSVQTVTASPTWPQPAITSNGWIGNVDTTDNIGIFYTTPVGFPEMFGTFPGDAVSGNPPLGKSNVWADGGTYGTGSFPITAYSGELFSSQFSVAVGTQQTGPSLIAQQAPAEFVVRSDMITNGVFSVNAAAYTASPGYPSEEGNPAAPTGWITSGGNSGINGPDTGFYGSSNGYEPFAPENTAGVSDFNFLQDKGAFSAQIVATTAGQSYTLAFDAAARAGNSSAVLEVMIMNPANGSQLITLTVTVHGSITAKNRRNNREAGVHAV